MGLRPKSTSRCKSKAPFHAEYVLIKIRYTERYLCGVENREKYTGVNGLYEIRIQMGSDIYRIFCFFDQGKLVVIANGFQKKSQKTPKQEIELALKIKGEYENETSMLRCNARVDDNNFRQHGSSIRPLKNKLLTYETSMETTVYAQGNVYWASSIRRRSLKK